MKKFIINTALILFVYPYMILGCASTRSMKSAPLTEGVQKTFSANFSDVLNAARESVIEVGLQIDEAYKVTDDVWVIICTKGVSAWSWGELVRIVIQKQDSSKTTVLVYTKRRLATNITSKGDYSKSIFSSIEHKL